MGAPSNDYPRGAPLGTIKNAGFTATGRQALARHRLEPHLYEPGLRQMGPEPPVSEIDSPFFWRFRIWET